MNKLKRHYEYNAGTWRVERNWNERAEGRAVQEEEEEAEPEVMDEWQAKGKEIRDLRCCCNQFCEK